jgi:prepilin-type N-terminal cleavage/methylation domain-containing protein/prepilin-type processing-associated H-X9-DG protein
LKKHISNQGFTLVEVLVVIAVIAILAVTVLATSRSLLSKSRTAKCSANLRQIGIACMMYAGDNNQTLPVTSHQRSKGGKSWTLTLQPYTSTTLTFKCPYDENKDRLYTYVINDFLTPNPAGAPELNYSILAKIDRPGATFMFAEASTTYVNSDHFHFSEYHGGTIPAEVFEDQVETGGHDGKSNYLFADGHVETLSRAETRSRLGAQGSRFVDPSGQ